MERPQKKKRFEVLKTAFREFMQADCLNLAASLSYYTVFSLAPMLLVVIAVASIFLGKDAVTGALMGQISGLVGEEAAQTIQTMIAHAYQPKSSRIAAIIGICTVALGSTGVFLQMQNCLNKIWGVKPKAKGKKQWLTQIKKRFLTFGMLMGVVFLLIVSLAVSAVVAAFWQYIANIVSGSSAVLLKIVEMALSLAFTTVLFAMIFKFLPDIIIKWKDVWKGGALTAILFEAGKNLIGLYLGRSSVASAYGGAGAIVLIMLWVNYSALILFFGAAFTKAYATLHGSYVVPEINAVPQQPCAPDQRRAA